MKYEPKNTSLSEPKHGKDDPENKPHTGGNTWAGGVRILRLVYCDASDVVSPRLAAAILLGWEAEVDTSVCTRDIISTKYYRVSCTVIAGR